MGSWQCHKIVIAIPLLVSYCKQKLFTDDSAFIPHHILQCLQDLDGITIFPRNNCREHFSFIGAERVSYTLCGCGVCVVPVSTLIK